MAQPLWRPGPPADDHGVSVHVFVDESRRGSTYLIAATVVEPQDLSRLRKMLRALLLPGQHELHFKKETPARRRAILSALVADRSPVHIYLANCRRGEEQARGRCMTQLVDDMLDLRARRLVMDTRETRNEHDHRIIRAALGRSARDTNLVYEHIVSTQDELLWIADAAAWCYGAGGDWRRRLQPVLGKVIDLSDKV